MIDIVCAVVLDLLIGDPPRFPHPVKLMGNLIAAEDKLVRKVALRSDGHHLEGGVHLIRTKKCSDYVGFFKADRRSV